MQHDLTELVLILDRSGSMESIKGETIGGINNLLDAQRHQPGSCNVTVIQFDDQINVLHNGENIQYVPNFNERTFVPRGMTKLHDAMGLAINNVGERLSRTPEEYRPSKVIVAVITDGCENASQEFSSLQIRDMVEHQQRRYLWEFTFVGANQDAILNGQSLGVNATGCLSWDATNIGTRTMYDSLNNAITSVRQGNSINYD